MAAPAVQEVSVISTGQNGVQSTTIQTARPFLKWAGGKGQLLKTYEQYFPKSFCSYHEPFLGGGAVFFYLAPRLQGRKVFLSDNNDELINAYKAVRDNVDELIRKLQGHAQAVSEDYFYSVRAMNPEDLLPVERAARLIFLNKTCFNGLYRVNRQGKFNVPFGKYKNPKICDDLNLRLCSAALQDVELSVGGFESVLARVQDGDFAYFDPPYVPVNKTASFTDYTKESFGQEQQERLADVFHELKARACKGMLSNSDTELVKELYREDTIIDDVKATRAINSRGDRRGPINEVLVLNYDPKKEDGGFPPSSRWNS